MRQKMSEKDGVGRGMREKGKKERTFANGGRGEGRMITPTVLNVCIFICIGRENRQSRGMCARE